MDIWEICEEIVSKSEWYHKVFDPVITEKWRAECKDQKKFALALSLVQASAKGCKISKRCEWEEGNCPECVEECRRHFTRNPEEIQRYHHCEECLECGKSEEPCPLSNEERVNEFFADTDWEYDEQMYDYINDQHCHHVRCKCVAPACELSDYIVYEPNGIINNNLHQRLKSAIKEMSEKEAIDWHPGSNQQVRDLIHPSLYCYVADNKDNLNSYRWLPSEFVITEGKVKIDSYINNLNSEKYPNFIPLLEEVFACYIPNLEQVLEKKLNSRSLQVITKVGSMILTKDNPKYNGGSWHLEGIVDEAIVATVIHYVDISGMTESYLEFRKPTIINEDELDYPQGDAKYTTHHYGIDSHYDGTMNRYLGLIKCSEGADVIFPNNLQHRVKEFALDGDNESLRTMIAFFIVDPDQKITSTADIVPQQNIMTFEDACKYRERLMYHRKYYVNAFNQEVIERCYSLCEH